MCICGIVNLFLTEFPKGEMASYLAILANWVFQTAAAACEGGIIFKGYE
jgi:hypothetical protein